jgi:hypothetical protein
VFTEGQVFYYYSSDAWITVAVNRIATKLTRIALRVDRQQSTALLVTLGFLSMLYLKFDFSLFIVITK